MAQVKVGDNLKHPVHGKLVVTKVEAGEYDEYIPEEKCFKKGYRVTAQFDRFIPGVRWHTGDADKKSMLIFHSWYLTRLSIEST